MKRINIVLLLLLGLVFINSCKKEKEIDKQKPEISLNVNNAFPLNCDTIYFGEPFTFKVLFTDNAALGSYSIDIHHNFDHHSHSTDVSECNMGVIKTAVNPVTFIQDYVIPIEQKSYETNISITIPKANNKGLFDEGDYHFFISLTDKEGWSAQKGLSIKILHR